MIKFIKRCLNVIIYREYFFLKEYLDKCDCCHQIHLEEKCGGRGHLSSCVDKFGNQRIYQ